MASFLKAARRSDPAAEPGSGDVAVPAPPVERWGPALALGAAELVGADATYHHGPEALPHGYGPWAFSFALAPSGRATESVDATIPDEAGLTARLGTDPADLEREVAAMALNRAHGCATPEVIGIIPLGDGEPGEATCALVTRAVTAIALPELIGFNLHHANELLDGFAGHHDSIHRLPIDTLAATAVVPTIRARDELDRIDRRRYPAEWAWLDEHLPAPVPPVLCHGGYQPLAVFGPPPEAWPELGGPGQGLTVVNWSSAVLAEPELDVAFTLVAFWSAPFFAPNRSERTAIKMIRNTLLNTYRQGYTARRDLDLDRLRFWQAFHALRGIARLAGAYDADGSPFAAGDRGAVPADLGPELHRHFRQLTRVR